MRPKDTSPQSQQRVNEQIRLSPIRVVSHDGTMLGIIPTADAMQIAREAGLDLVEVAPKERPPVCRIMDFGKFKYQQKKRQSVKPPHQTQVKEIRLRPKTGDHDIGFKIKRARNFISHRDKVKVNILFRGREHAHQDRGREILNSVIEELGDVAKVEKPPGMEGRMMTTVLAPK